MCLVQIFSVNVIAGALLVKEAYPCLLKSKLVPAFILHCSLRKVLLSSVGARYVPAFSQRNKNISTFGIVN